MSTTNPLPLDRYPTAPVMLTVFMPMVSLLAGAFGPNVAHTVAVVSGTIVLATWLGSVSVRLCMLLEQISGRPARQ